MKEIQIINKTDRSMYAVLWRLAYFLSGDEYHALYEKGKKTFYISSTPDNVYTIKELTTKRG